ncbi:hypothetical protein WM40_10380 [Robbsia andropogonis]|uniref:Uncharacterized protein n=1 Tax=Robbsia andropogonis TaxID=28092 RepID=A0A0F5K0U3_9BURK|nr:hypothetical protein WM40_10380 [Robbsia andropogonis]
MLVKKENQMPRQHKAASIIHRRNSLVNDGIGAVIFGSRFKRAPAKHVSLRYWGSVACIRCVYCGLPFPKFSRMEWKNVMTKLVSKWRLFATPNYAIS